MGALRYPPTLNGLQKSLASALNTGVTASMTLNNVTGVQNKPGVVVVDRIDSGGALKSTSVREFIAYTATSGSTLTTLTRNVDNSSSDQDHAIGAIVEFIPDVTWGQAVIDALALYVDPTDNTIRDIQGGEMIIDADNDTSMTADTDDQIDWKLGGSDRFRMKTSDFDVVTSTGNIQVAGADPKRGMYIPASSLFPATTNGCAALAQSETSTNKINYKYLAFDGTSDEYAWIHLPQAPDYWDLSTMTAKFHWTPASGSGIVSWGLAALCRSDDDALDTALGSSVGITDTVLAVGDYHTSASTPAMTVGGTPTKGDGIYIRVFRFASDGGDTLNGIDAHLIGVTIKFGIGQFDDQ